MVYANIYEPDERITIYQAYTEAIAKFDEIMQSREADVEEEAEKERMASMIKETLIAQEPEVITCEVSTTMPLRHAYVWAIFVCMVEAAGDEEDNRASSTKSAGPLPIADVQSSNSSRSASQAQSANHCRAWHLPCFCPALYSNYC